jgi:hypothetical protein
MSWGGLEGGGFFRHPLVMILRHSLSRPGNWLSPSNSACKWFFCHGKQVSPMYGTRALKINRVFRRIFASVSGVTGMQGFYQYLHASSKCADF